MEQKLTLMLTPDELAEIVADAVDRKLNGVPLDKSTPAPGKRYVYGLRGIRELFNVSIATAQRYKNTFLAPAIMQRGRKIVVDADEAMKLYAAR